jgi:hypothetical protein
MAIDMFGHKLYTCVLPRSTSTLPAPSSYFRHLVFRCSSPFVTPVHPLPFSPLTPLVPLTSLTPLTPAPDPLFASSFSYSSSSLSIGILYVSQSGRQNFLLSHKTDSFLNRLQTSLVHSILSCSLRLTRHLCRRSTLGAKMNGPIWKSSSADGGLASCRNGGGGTLSTTTRTAPSL